MDELRRIKKVINWLIYKEVAVSEKDLADKLGYTKSSFSQLVTGKVPLSDKFIGKLCSLDENINKVWIRTGEGQMLSDDKLNGEKIEVPAEVWQVIKRQADGLSSRDRQIDDLISLLRDQINENKKINARQDALATSAVVG